MLFAMRCQTIVDPSVLFTPWIFIQCNQHVPSLLNAFQICLIPLLFTDIEKRNRRIGFVHRASIQELCPETLIAVTIGDCAVIFASAKTEQYNVAASFAGHYTKDRGLYSLSFFKYL
jgi:hypothetical protein